MDHSTVTDILELLVKEIASTCGSEQGNALDIEGKRENQAFFHDNQGSSPLQKQMDSLRIGVKYLLFDLEATRRENQYLRKILESHD